MEITINFFLEDNNECIKIWYVNNVPRIGETIIFEEYDPLKVNNVTWIGPRLVEIKLK